MRVLSLLFGLLAVCCAVGAQAQSVSSLQGTVNGIRLTTSQNGVAAQTQVNAYLGIPFGRPTGGQLRFAPPVATANSSFQAQASSSVVAARLSSAGYAATSFAPICLQVNTNQTAPNPPILGSEDCLFLNVYTPVNTTSTSNLPVFVWITGGGFITGSGNSYPGENLVASSLGAQSLGSEASSGIIVVTINYRVGVLGFLAHPILSTQNAPGTVASSGNQGIRDQIAALQWVKQNIAAYGGNPNAVTVGGESAGAISTCILITSPKAAGLFNRAILESGGCDNGGNGQATTLPQAEVLGQRYLAFVVSAVAQQLATTTAQLNALVNANNPAFAPLIAQATQGVRNLTQLNTVCNISSAEVQLAFCLRVVSDTAPQLFILAGVNSGVTAFFGRYAMIPMVDGDIAPDYPGNALKNGNFNKVPLLIGSNVGEMFAFLGAGSQFGDTSTFTADTVNSFIDAYASNSSTNAQLKAVYAPSNPRFAAAGSFAPVVSVGTLLSRAIFQCPTLRLAQAARDAGQQVFSYRFDYVDALWLQAADARAPGTAALITAAGGAVHAGELAYVFNAPLSSFVLAQASSFGVKNNVQNYWIKFIMTGNPNFGEGPLPALTSAGLAAEPLFWPPLDAQSTLLVFNRTGAVNTAPVSALYADCDPLWKPTVFTSSTPFQPVISKGTPAQQEQNGANGGNGVDGAASVAAPSVLAAIVAVLAMAFVRSA